MISSKLFQFGSPNGTFQILILKFRHTTTLRTNHVMMRLVPISPLILRRTSKLMLDHQVRIHQQDDGVVKCCPTNTEMSFSPCNYRACQYQNVP